MACGTPLRGWRRRRGTDLQWSERERPERSADIADQRQRQPEYRCRETTGTQGKLCVPRIGSRLPAQSRMGREEGLPRA